MSGRVWIEESRCRSRCGIEIKMSFNIQAGDVVAGYKIISPETARSGWSGWNGTWYWTIGGDVIVLLPNLFWSVPYIVIIHAILSLHSISCMLHTHFSISISRSLDFEVVSAVGIAKSFIHSGRKEAEQGAFELWVKARLFLVSFCSFFPCKMEHRFLCVHSITVLKELRNNYAPHYSLCMLNPKKCALFHLLVSVVYRWIWEPDLSLPYTPPLRSDLLGSAQLCSRFMGKKCYAKNVIQITPAWP